jgi:hypothetical protein
MSKDKNFGPVTIVSVRGLGVRKERTARIEKLMIKIVPVILVAVLLSWGAVAQQSKQPQKSTSNSKTPHIPASRNPCAQYGPGFVKVAGSDMCVKIGGGVGVEVGGGGRR